MTYVCEAYVLHVCLDLRTRVVITIWSGPVDHPVVTLPRSKQAEESYDTSALHLADLKLH